MKCENCEKTYEGEHEEYCQPCLSKGPGCNVCGAQTVVSDVCSDCNQEFEEKMYEK